MVYFLYNFAWTLVFIFALPLFYLTRGRRISERLGLGLPSERKREKSIWIHALSVGEVISALPLVKEIRERYPSKSIIFTVKTAQGMKIARDELKGKVEALLPMPLDFWWSIRRLVNHINPSVLLLIETDIWPGLISFLKKKGLRVILINGRISPRTFRSYKIFRFLTRRLLSDLELCLMQSNLDMDRLLDIGGIPTEKIRVVGNIKFDRPWKPMDKKEREYWSRSIYLKPENRVWVAGSTHDKENEIILGIFKRLKELFPELVLVIAPRKVEEAEDAYRLSESMGLKTLRRTDGDAGRGHSYEVMVLNTIGELGRVYGLADISFVGGSMVPFGGHNLLEPAGFGCPVLFGVHTHNFVLMSRLITEAGGGKRVRDPEELFKTIRALLSDKAKSRDMGAKAREFVEKNNGALERVMEHVGEYFETA